MQIHRHHVQLSLAEAYAAACTMKHMLEHTGRYRPNFLARLATGDAKLIEDGASGYPSGHALYTFMTCILISCYLLGRFQVLAASTRGHYLKFIMCMLPIYLAVTESLERVVCYEHDYSDTLAGTSSLPLYICLLLYLSSYTSYVLCAEPECVPECDYVYVGGCIGAAMGFLGYTLNFGSLFDPVTCGVPKVRSAWTMNEVDSVGGENEEDQRDYEEALLQGHTS